MKMYFDLVFRCDNSGEPSGNGKHIAFRRAASSSDVPDDLLSFMRKVRIENIVINDVFSRNEKLGSDLLDMLLVCARVGAEGDDYDVALGQHELNFIEREVIRRATRTRSSFVFTVYGWCLLWLIIAALGLTYLHYDNIVILGASLPKISTYIGQSAFNLISAFLYCLAGISIAVSISATIRLRNITREILEKFDPYNFRPIERLTYVTILSIGIMIILYFPVVKLGLGDVLLNDYKDRPSLGILIGLLAGASEPVLARFFEQSLRPNQNTQGNPATDPITTPAGPSKASP